MEGGETELDRSLLEAIRDPLTHILRNSVDHGVETPAKRRQAGKSGPGSITVAAALRGSQVDVLVEDDGRGGAYPSVGTGLTGLRDRAAAAGGSLEVLDGPGRGTLIRAALPAGGPRDG